MYNGQELSFDTSSFSTSLRYKIHAQFGKHEVPNILKFKNWGPPYYKTKKTFQSAPSAPTTSGSLHPEQKTAAWFAVHLTLI